MNRSHAWALFASSALTNEAELDIAAAANVADEMLGQFDLRFRTGSTDQDRAEARSRSTAEELVTRALVGYVNDPADSDYQRGFLDALIQVAEEMIIDDQAPMLEDLKRQLHKPEARYCVDGHENKDYDSPTTGDGQFPPFYVFDIVGQQNLPGVYGTRQQAQVVADLLNT